jgi:hypothetical protein
MVVVFTVEPAVAVTVTVLVPDGVAVEGVIELPPPPPQPENAASIPALISRLSNR